MFRSTSSSLRTLVAATLLVSPLALSGCEDLIAQATNGVISQISEQVDAALTGLDLSGGYTCDDPYDGSNQNAGYDVPGTDADSLFDSSWDSWNCETLPYSNEPIWG